MITYKQLTLAEIFEDCQNKFDNDKYRFIYSSLTSISLPTNTQNGRVAGLVVISFRFQKIIPKYMTSNPRSQPDIHFCRRYVSI